MAKSGKSAPFKGTNYKGKDEEGEDQYQPRPNDFLDFQSNLIPVKFITRISIIDEYDYEQSVPIYRIIINPDPSERMFFCNTIASFYSAEKRDTYMAKIKEQLYGCNIVFTDVNC